MSSRTDQKRHLKLVPLPEALKAVLGQVTSLPSEEIDVLDALDRVSAEKIVAGWDVPRFSVSAMDGYAVRATDLELQKLPRKITVKGRLKPGGTKNVSVRSGEAYYVATGARIPTGADAVLRVEETRYVDERTISVSKDVKPGKNISARGEDLKQGEVVLRKGERISPGALSLLVHFGVRRVRVVRRPRIGVVSIGDELADFEKGDKDKGKLYNNYAYLVTSYLGRYGFKPVRLGVVSDKEDHLASALKKALKSMDLVLTLGGTSVGLWDNTPGSVMKIPGFRMIFHGLRAVPIKPVGVASAGDTKGGLVMLLPGHAVSALLAIQVLCLPVLSVLSGGSADDMNLRLRLTLGSKLENPRNIDALYLVRLVRKEGELVAMPIGWGSNLMSSVLRAHGFVALAPRETVDAGARLQVELLGPQSLYGCA